MTKYRVSSRKAQTSDRPRIVFVGGGHTHALVLHALRSAHLANAELTVINPGKSAPYSGMLPGFVAGHYDLNELEIDLARLSNSVGAGLIDGRAVAIDPKGQIITLEDGFELPYDLASVDIGITTKMDLLTGFSEHGIPAKPLADFAASWDTYRASKGSKSIAIIGGGIAGAELSMAMSFALRGHKEPVKVTILDRGNILSTNSEAAQRKLRREILRNNVNIIEQAEVQSVTRDGVTFNDGKILAANFVVGAAGATPHPWLTNTGLQLHEGFIVVDEFLRSSSSNVFAVGDCAHLAFDPRPKAGVFAVRQAPVLVENIRRALSGSSLQEYKPQSDYLKLVSLGGKRAFGEKLGFGLSGRLVWKVKDRIDRGFMKQFF